MTAANYTLASGREILVVFIASSSCQGVKRADLRNAVRQMTKLVKEQGRTKHISTLGVSVDWLPQKGISFLNQIGDFDQVAAGHNWINEGAVKFLWNDSVAEQPIPQVLVIERTISVSEHRVAVTDEHVIRREVGPIQIRDWVAAGMPVNGTAMAVRLGAKSTN
ncbi:MAG: hypothetical protein ACR2OG_00040 [Gemmatimonadaceae bacterium]